MLNKYRRSTLQIAVADALNTPVNYCVPSIEGPIPPRLLNVQVQALAKSANGKTSVKLTSQ